MWGLLAKGMQGLQGALKHYILKIKFKEDHWIDALFKLDTQMKDIRYLASWNFVPEGKGKVTGFIESWRYPENFEEIMKNRDERILKIDIFSKSDGPQQMTGDSLEGKRCIQDRSVNGNNADSRRSFNATDMKSSGSYQGKNVEVVENIQPKEDDKKDEIRIIVPDQDNDARDCKELVPLSRKATDLNEL